MTPPEALESSPVLSGLLLTRIKMTRTDLLLALSAFLIFFKDVSKPQPILS
jgi:hypothetical protein